MNKAVAAVGMAMTFGIGVWIAQPHGQSKPHEQITPRGNAGPDWRLDVRGHGTDLATCMWTDNKERMLQQGKWGDTPTPVVTGWNSNVPRVTVKMSFGDKPVVRALIAHSGDTIQLGRHREMWATCSDIDNQFVPLQLVLYRDSLPVDLEDSQPNANVLNAQSPVTVWGNDKPIG